ncbi:Aldehyde/histidinol dehydrogenase [Truncatella angustata]|uniref:aldehyde dehydrogenase (NAD(+)) n=1 Tax=Truncatella angustata TaxID=152316 RepID=A0A9P8USQ0_9PEZI|nr:Aldehyde/histidinol dehydrogenase [Truncatella angustata]KAH6657644.1 Aldehyde/histidinol dehydrogenase [Truncatella angustata]KAH8194223.1 hypothetical protein TruAng_011610 [Truncatella angustata]
MTKDHSEFEFFNVIGGQPRRAKEYHRVTDPRTEQELWKSPVATSQDLDDAVAAGLEAFKSFKWSTTAERRELLLAVRQSMLDNVDVLTTILAKETGKSKLMAQIEVERGAAHFEYYADVQLEDELQYEDDTMKIIATHAPYGVIGAISPWNFPLILSAVKIASALATGNCVIIKPSPFTPYTILKACELAQSVVPPGVYQALGGDADIGEAMTLHPGIPHISFTGTIGVGKKIAAICAQTLKKTILELAGNNASIILEDADLADAVPKVAVGSLFHAGQMCVAAKRIYVHDKIYDQFLELLAKEVEKYGETDDSSTPSIYSPLSNRVNYERCLSILEDCKKNEYKIITGGATTGGKGFWIPPTIVANPPEDSLLVSEEQFGPLIPVMSWSEEADVIKRANIDNAGLGASIYSTNINRAQELARKLESGTVWINMAERPHHAGWFAGQKLSGLGGEMGKQGLLSYCHTQSIQIAK